MTAPASAQTREEEIGRRQEEKAREVKPYEMNRAERLFEQLEKGRLFLGVPRGWYATLGSVALGGGLAAGGGYRKYVGYDSFIDAGALYSIRGYKKAELSALTPGHLSNHLDLSGLVRWVDATQLPFYGLGMDSSTDDRRTYRLTRTRIEGGARLRPVRWMRLRFDGGVDDYDQKSGLGRVDSIEQHFTAATAPLLGEQPRYLRGQASADIYWLDSPNYSRSGGLYRVAYEEFNPKRGASSDAFAFLHTELVQHVPIARETWIVSLRARTDSIVRQSDVVPFFLLPTIGGGDTLRGYATHRFSDRHAMVLSGELRWLPNRLGMDMALFFDAGKVASDRSGLDFSGLKTDYGIGVRFHGPTHTILRFDLARGDEGTRLVISAGPSF